MFNILTVCLIARMAFAWNDQVHMMIAKIAKNHLEPGALRTIEVLAEDVNGEFPPPFDFIEAACWANVISRGGCKAFDPWHERPMPYDPEKILNDGREVDQNSVIFALNQAVGTLNNPKAGAWEKNFCLRILLHGMGNLHHPLACSSLYSSEFPKGDRGGRLFSIQGRQSLRDLWDNLFGLMTDEYDPSFEQQQEMDEVLKEILLHFPRNALSDRMQGDFETWADQSFQLAVNQAYQGICSGAMPPPDYIIRCREIAFMQIALAGYRLADKLNEIFDK